jgi:hypothetical protein
MHILFVQYNAAKKYSILSFINSNYLFIYKHIHFFIIIIIIINILDLKILDALIDDINKRV